MRLINKILSKTIGIKFVKLNEAGNNPFIDIKNIFGTDQINTIFDVGANEGQTTAKLLPIFPKAKIYSFEPGNEAFNKLTKQYASNNNIQTMNIGLGEKNETLQLIMHKASVTNSFLTDVQEAKSFITKDMSIVGYENVEIFRLINFCEQNSINSIDLLKIDTQGFEMNVLNGAGNMLNPRVIKSVLTEVCFTNLYKNQATFCEIENLMRNKGYALVDFYDKNRAGGLTLKWADLLFISKEIL